MESIPEHLKFSRSAETLEHEGISIEAYLDNLEQDLKEELERIMRDEKMLGEGEAGKVFEVHASRSKCQACVKVWHPHLEKLKSENYLEYRQIQALDPEDEFNLQDDLYISGFRNIPRPFAFAKIGNLAIMGMEKVQGYTLQDIKSAGAHIANPAWKDLDRLLFELNISHKVLHRDIHKSNIMLRTSDKLAPGGELSGELVFIDLGRGRKIHGRPTPDDYRLTIGNNVISYTQDKSAVEQLRPNPRTPDTNIFTR
ncbi:MAG TPA: hypothetical protein VMT99_00645 [Candidatus Paceibacterota bacterium]|nr:hypothetical protein [Candidatus Paceibacterota bacterium]